ncbi:MAG: phosphatase [Nitriliruptorales bacterium]|nr:phosphatase [Nitriliruptorales bacterium]
MKSRLAGEVGTPPRSTLTNCARLVAGDDRYTFGLPDWQDASLLEAVGAVRALCGGDPGGVQDQHGHGWIDPDRTLESVALHRDRLAELAGSGGGRVLLATGHPTGLLPHYAAIARALQWHGSELLAPLDDLRLASPAGAPNRFRGIRFLDGVGCVFDGGRLLHTHRARYMEAMLDRLGGGPGVVDLVVADHGMAGAAIARGVPTLSIADVNDPALPLAQARGRTDGVLAIDDNLAPRLFVPVTQAMLLWP